LLRKSFNCIEFTMLYCSNSLNLNREWCNNFFLYLYTRQYWKTILVKVKLRNCWRVDWLFKIELWGTFSNWKMAFLIPLKNHVQHKKQTSSGFFPHEDWTFDTFKVKKCKLSANLSWNALFSFFKRVHLIQSEKVDLT